LFENIEIFTSAYWHPKVKKSVNEGNAIAVGITLYPNKQDYGYRLSGYIPELAPDRKLFPINDLDSFEQPFHKLLSQKWDVASRKLDRLALLNPSKAIILLCFDKVTEDPKDWCHRTVVGDFIYEQIGKRVTEL